MRLPRYHPLDSREGLGMQRENLPAPSEADDKPIHCGRQVISTRTGMSFLTGMVSSDGGSILKSASVAGIVPDIRVSFARVTCSSGSCLYLAVWPANWISRSA